MNGGSPLPEYIPTVADARVLAVLLQSVQSNCPGLVLFGDPGAGTTSMVRQGCKRLTTSEGEGVPLLEMANGAQNRSDSVFWACTLRSCGIDHRDGASAKQLYPTAIAHARELASMNSRQRLVLMVDDAQYLEARGLRWVYKFVCDLRDVSVRPMVVLVGGNTPDSMTRTAKSIAAPGGTGSLVSKFARVEGFLSVDEVRESLRRIDDQLKAWLGSNAYLEHTSPRHRLASYAELIWREFEAIEPAGIGRASVPVSAFASWVRAALAISRPAHERLSADQVRSALGLVRTSSADES